MSDSQNDDMDYIFRNVENELNRMNKTKKKIVKQSEQSFLDWLGNAIVSVGRAMGRAITVSAKAVSDLWAWLFGR